MSKNNMQIRLLNLLLTMMKLNLLKRFLNYPGWVMVKKLKEFEKNFSKFIGSKFSIGLNSCTAALHIALAANKFRRKKKVLVPVMTFSATAASILYNDLEPIFVDINKEIKY